MKTYTLSVNTLMWNLTLERHDNCAPCLGLILPIRWVTPPPNVLFWSVSLMVLPCYVFTFGLASISTCLHDYLHYVDYIYILVFCPLQHSLIAMSSCWIFWTKWMWSDPNLSMLSISNSICPNHMHSIETMKCLLCILVSRRHRDKHQFLLNDSSLLLKSGEAGTTIRQTWRAWERGTTLSMLHACDVPLRCEPPGAPA